VRHGGRMNASGDEAESHPPLCFVNAIPLTAN
jgi:hypothetical protein